jgi:hypothetical protein
MPQLVQEGSIYSEALQCRQLEIREKFHGIDLFYSHQQSLRYYDPLVVETFVITARPAFLTGFCPARLALRLMLKLFVRHVYATTLAGLARFGTTVEAPALIFMRVNRRVDVVFCGTPRRFLDHIVSVFFADSELVPKLVGV